MHLTQTFYALGDMPVSSRCLPPPFESTGTPRTYVRYSAHKSTILGSESEGTTEYH